MQAFQLCMPLIIVHPPPVPRSDAPSILQPPFSLGIQRKIRTQKSALQLCTHRLARRRPVNYAGANLLGGGLMSGRDVCVMTTIGRLWPRAPGTVHGRRRSSGWRRGLPIPWEGGANPMDEWTLPGRLTRRHPGSGEGDHRTTELCVQKPINEIFCFQSITSELEHTGGRGS